MKRAATATLIALATLATLAGVVIPQPASANLIGQVHIISPINGAIVAAGQPITVTIVTGPRIEVCQVGYTVGYQKYPTTKIEFKKNLTLGWFLWEGTWIPPVVEETTEMPMIGVAWGCNPGTVWLSIPVRINIIPPRVFLPLISNATEKES